MPCPICGGPLHEIKRYEYAQPATTEGDADDGIARAVERMVGPQPPQPEQELQAALDYERGHRRGLVMQISILTSKNEKQKAEITELKKQLSELEAKHDNLLQASKELERRLKDTA